MDTVRTCENYIKHYNFKKQNKSPRLFGAQGFELIDKT
jgi:hypothetical protein